MVERQIIARGVRDRRVIEAFLKVPRHFFVPSEFQGLAYHDSPLPIGEGQTISQPYIVALMLELLTIEPTDRILEIGTGSGYQTALLAELGKEVYSIERIEVLLERARVCLDSLGYTNVFLFRGDGTKGLPQFAPYQKIVVSACAGRIYESWIEELAEGGIIVLPLEEKTGQNLIRGIKREGQLHLENYGGCIFVPLIEE
ncbi:MAG: protein-L-isoaspartate(D-aspartate) O-methyltransferase [Atribacterota bacterium]|nr:protein-L-isoaspartate(D-aspartate) O-methyltransferase [Atribacterota bacterium]